MSMAGKEPPVILAEQLYGWCVRGSAAVFFAPDASVPEAFKPRLIWQMSSFGHAMLYFVPVRGQAVL